MSKPKKQPQPWETPDLWGDRKNHLGLKLMGYWAGPSEPELPDPRELVDPDWNASIREAVSEYLGRPDFVERRYAAAGFSRCRFCKAISGTGELSDGLYVWPEGLVHYLRHHHVRLPDDIVEHILTARGGLKTGRQRGRAQS